MFKAQSENNDIVDFILWILYTIVVLFFFFFYHRKFLEIKLKRSYRTCVSTNIRCLWWTVIKIHLGCYRAVSVLEFNRSGQEQFILFAVIYVNDCVLENTGEGAMPKFKGWQGLSIDIMTNLAFTSPTLRSILLQFYSSSHVQHIYIVKQPFIDPCGLFWYEFIISVCIISPFGRTDNLH